jgi:hypothetical protein
MSGRNSSKKPVGVHGTDKETGRTRTGDTGGDTGEKVKKPDISKEEFETNAPNMIDLGQVLANKFANKKTFKKGSYGFFLNDKVVANVGGKLVKFQATINLTVANSKPKGADADEEEAGAGE